MDWKLISATVTNRVSRPLAKWLVVFGLHIYPSRIQIDLKTKATVEVK